MYPDRAVETYLVAAGNVESHVGVFALARYGHLAGEDRGQRLGIVRSDGFDSRRHTRGVDEAEIVACLHVDRLPYILGVDGQHDVVAAVEALLPSLVAALGRHYDESIAARVECECAAYLGIVVEIFGDIVVIGLRHYYPGLRHREVGAQTVVAAGIVEQQVDNGHIAGRSGILLQAEDTPCQLGIVGVSGYRLAVAHIPYIYLAAHALGGKIDRHAVICLDDRRIVHVHFGVDHYHDVLPVAAHELGVGADTLFGREEYVERQDDLVGDDRRHDRLYVGCFAVPLVLLFQLGRRRGRHGIRSGFVVLATYGCERCEDCRKRQKSEFFHGGLFLVEVFVNTRAVPNSFGLCRDG